MYTIEEQYNIHRQKPSDINEHLPILYKYALECDAIAEFGVRNVCSSYAFAHARPKKLICVDIQQTTEATEFIKLCLSENINAAFFHADTLTFELEEVDMLFIDTWHTFKQLSQELKLHGNKAKKYIIFHDTITFGVCDEGGNSGENCGLQPAIANFLKENSHWKELATYKNNNGLTILKNNLYFGTKVV